MKPTRMPFGRGLRYSLRLMWATLTFDGDGVERVITEVEAFWAGQS